MSDEPVLITTIIPFYQREEGVLRRAVETATMQSIHASHRQEIIVVDDGSPITAESELLDLVTPKNCSVRIVSQANAGPASARNAGLDAVVPECAFIAFLDSDDLWESNHLENAIKALAQNADFYFSDFFQLNQRTSAFDRAGRINLQDHTLLEGSHSLYRYNGSMIKQIVTGNIIGTSTVVYRYPSAAHLRFREEFFNAGEDYLFWIDFCFLNRPIVFSTDQEVKYGKGINIYSGAEWGSIELFERMINEIRYRKLSLKLLSLDGDTEAIVKNKIGILRFDISRQIVRGLLLRQKGIVQCILDTWKTDPATLLLSPFNIIRRKSPD